MIVLLCTACFFVAGLVLDGGNALSAKLHAFDTAQGAARAGAQQLDLTTYRTTGAVQLDPAKAAQAARTWLTAAGATGTVAATTQTVTVTVTASTGTQLLQIVGVTTLHVSATATATPVHAVTGP
jgi:hypothetical protein